MHRNTFLLFALFALISACGNKSGETSTNYPMTSKEIPNLTAGRPFIEAPRNDMTPKEAPGTPDAQTLAIGLNVYKSTCSICHKSGLNGAPRMGSKKDWEPRIAQGAKVLYEHSIQGYRGTKGSMPSRGSNPRLSEAEVKAAVDYIVEHAIPAWSVD